MTAEKLIEQRKAAWDRLASTVNEIYRRGPRAVPPERIEEMIHLYRQASADLARLRTLEADRAHIANLNRLVSRAHAQIYRSRPRRPRSLLRFFLVEYPRLFRRTGRFTFASFLLCAVVYTMAYQAVQSRPALIADILGGGDEEFIGDKAPEDIIERFRSTPSSVLSAAVTTNNIQVALFAFALGATFGLGTLYVLVVNSAMVGGIAGAFARSGIEGVLWSTILPHGALELSAIVIAGGAGLVMGWALWCPGQRTRSRALQEEAVNAALLALGLIPAFIVAGLFEGFVTPSETIPQWLKVALGVAAAVLFWLYLFLGGREGFPGVRSAAAA